MIRQTTVQAEHILTFCDWPPFAIVYYMGFDEATEVFIYCRENNIDLITLADITTVYMYIADSAQEALFRLRWL